ncbi:aspartyl-phosphate phosphatase Spo0E family protein [Desulfosporosinus meridiei]|nr:aspartyl-phosphate phosphatase Spo0E family protein [Desulfosporosinus meridiei]
MIDKQIEELRLQMHEVASDKKLTDQRVVSISCKLDLLINEFYLRDRLKANSEYKTS